MSTYYVYDPTTGRSLKLIAGTNVLLTPIGDELRISATGGGSGGSALDVVQGRLTLESGVPISTSDQLAKTTLYFTPYRGNQISLYDGVSAWALNTLTERSSSLAGLTADKNFDVFIYDSAGVLTLDLTQWTNDSTRATALVLQDGVYVKSGATTRRYIGTIRTTGTTGQCEDSDVKRYVWNYINQVTRRMYVFEEASHNYTTGAWRNWNNTTTARLQFVVGLQESSLVAHGTFTNNTNNANCGIAINAVSPSYTGTMYAQRTPVIVAFLPALGYNVLQAQEYGEASDNQFRVDLEAIVAG